MEMPHRFWASAHVLMAGLLLFQVAFGWRLLKIARRRDDGWLEH